MGTTAEKLQAIINSKSAIKTAINSKGGSITDSTPLDEYATAISNLPSGGTADLDGYLQGTITKLVSGATPTVSAYTCYNNNVIEEVEFTDLEYISNPNCFYNCSNLATLSFPNLDTISSTTFYNIGATEINDSMFPKLAYITQAVFSSCSKLISVTLSNLQSCSGTSFAVNPKMELLDLSGCTFTSTGNIAKSSSQSVTNGCVLKLPATCNSIGNLSFQYTRFKEIWLYNPNQIVLYAAGGISLAQSTGNPIAVYVPSSILATYQADSSFTNLVNNNKITLNAIPE